MKYLCGVVLFIALIATGCSSGDDEQQPSITEQLRRTVDPQVGEYLVRGQRAFERGAYTLALAYSDSAEGLAPNLADIHFLRGKIYTQLNQLDVAEIAYNVVMELDPAYHGARYNLALNAFRRGRLRDAIDLYVEEQAINETSGLLHELGRAYAKLGEPDSARMAYQRAIELDSTNATAHMWLGQLFEEIGELDKALEHSRTGLELKPDNLDYQYIVGSLLYRSEKSEEAVGYLERVANERAWHHGAQFNLGQVYMRLGREEEAKVFFARADSAQQVQQEINEAQNAINREPDNLEHWITLATLLRRTGQLDRAVEAYKNAVTLEPWNLHLQSNLALLIMQTGDQAGAIRRFRAILTLDSTLADIWLNLGVAYANSGQKQDAQASWEKTLQLHPGHPTARAYLARVDEIEEGS